MMIIIIIIANLLSSVFSGPCIALGMQALSENQYYKEGVLIIIAISQTVEKRLGGIK